MGKLLELLISIHALREEGDATRMAARARLANFYPRPPRGGRHFDAFATLSTAYFYPRPPRGGRQAASAAPFGGLMISIHALREEGDGLRHGTAAPPEDFYPRPPRGGRLGQDGRRATDWLFLSTPSARRATCPVRMMCRIEEFLSTPSARRATGP